MITVLLVDDQRFIGAAIGEMLATEPDIELHCCRDAVHAIARANEVAPTLILQDLVMPDIDGLTLVGLFRGNPPTAATPIIVLSANDDADTRTQALAAGANDYLVKVPTKDNLTACIRRHAIGPQVGELSAADRPRPAPEERAEETLDPLVMAMFRQDGSSDFTLTLIDQFIQEAESRVETVRDAARRQDASVLKATAHNLKGSSLIMGAKRLAALCTQLEDSLQRHPGGAVAPGLVAAFDEEFVHVREAFAAERRGLGQSASQQVPTQRSNDESGVARL